MRILIPFFSFTETNKKLQICSQLLYLHLQKLKKIVKAGGSSFVLKPCVILTTSSFYNPFNNLTFNSL